MVAYLSAVYTEVGLRALVSSRRDVKVLCLQRFVRFFAFGSTTLVLTLLLKELGYSTEKIGLFMTVSFLGDVLVSLVLTTIADKIGRRRMLAFAALMMSVSGIIFAQCSQYWILVLTGVFGIISPSGSEIGPFKAIEESTISQLVPSIDRSSVIAWYNLFQTSGAAVGSVCIGWVVDILQHKFHWKVITSYRFVFWVYAALGIAKFALCLLLSREAEVKTEEVPVKSLSGERRPLLPDSGSEEVEEVEEIVPSKGLNLSSFFSGLSGHTARLLVKLCILFSMDSFGAGIASNSWFVYFFNTKFHIEEGDLGSLFFCVNILAASSNLGAAALSRKIGLIKTMVLTHLPASALLTVLPIPNNAGIAMAILLVRASLTKMAQAPRQAFIAAAVLPEERTMVMGIVNVCRTLSQAGGPVTAGAFSAMGNFGAVFILAGAIKCAYDLLILCLFSGYKTIEERAEAEIQAEVETGVKRPRGSSIGQNLESP